MKFFRIATPVVCLTLSACTFESPVDPANLGPSLFASLLGGSQQFDSALADPLGAKPFPRVIGGDSERIFYATNLGDIRVKFPGPTNDIVFPGLVGPSNLYVYRDRQRELLRPLVPSGALGGLTTDGQYVAYLQWATDDQEPRPDRVLVGSIATGDVVEVTEDVGADGFVLPDLRLDGGRLAYIVWSEQGTRLYVRPLDAAAAEFVTQADDFISIDLKGSRLAYISFAEAGAGVYLVDLSTGEQTILASNVEDAQYGNQVLLTANSVVWSEGGTGFDLPRIMRYDIATGEQMLWIDAADGELAGASDTYVLTQRRDFADPGETERIVITRYNTDGKSRVLADFRADGRAGQAQVLGDRAVFVNPERRVVVAPLEHGDRTSFKPF